MRTKRYEYNTIGQSQSGSLLCSLLITVFTFTFIGVTTYLVTRPDKRNLNILAPLYVFPHSAWQTIDPQWLTLEKSAVDNPDVQQVVVLNPANGAGALWATGTNDYGLWKTVTDKLKVLKNVKLVGYVATGYGDSTKVTTAKQQIDGYFQNWPVEGIFFDETGNQQNANNMAIYKDYVAYTETKLKGAFDVFNFGSTVDQNSVEYSDDWLKLAELNVMYEEALSNLDTFEPSQAQKNLPHSRSALLMHATHKYSDINLDEAYKKQFGYVYFTHGNISSTGGPWAHILPDYDKFVKDLQDFT